MNTRQIFQVFFLFLVFPLASQTILLNNNWKFKNIKDTIWLEASVPGCVHTDLYKNKKIQDPFYGANEKSVQWIENETWEYNTVFDYDMTRDSALLCFEGLDTYCEIYINNTKMLSTENMFLHYEIKLKKSKMLPNGNELLLVFTSSLKKDEERKKILGRELPGAYAYTRKAAYQYGWDWGPRLLTVGIWKDIYLKYYTLPEVNYCNLIQTKLTLEKAILNLKFSLRRPAESSYYLNVYNLSDQSHELVSELKPKKKETIDGIIIDSLEDSIEIKSPKLWWCHGYGEPFLYQFKIDLLREDGTMLYDTVINLGLRNIELVQQKDNYGKSFYFRINGIPVFCKGANMIPISCFASDENEMKYKNLVDQALEVNMNMLRVWGGGFYPDNSFYNYCDEKGILVWQDFMFACSVYPIDNAFKNSVMQEIKQQVYRIGNHACIALWCGNNEVSEGWNNWGWQKQFHYSASDSIILWNANRNLFEHLIPKILHESFPQSNYWPSSPSIGWGHEEAKLSGDMHYWGVWWGQEPFEKYISHTGRFMSEFGFQSLPEMNSLRKFLPGDSLQLNTAAIKTHQKHPVGFETINTYMSRRLPPPTDLEKYAYFSQYIQAEGMRIGIESHRRNRPYCMGTLYWQLNDCWPAISWSSVDYYGRWKKFHFDLKRLYSTYLISPIIREDSVYIYIVSDSINQIEAELSIRLKNVMGKVIYSFQKTTKIDVLNSSIACVKSVKEINISEGDYFEINLSINGNTLAENIMPVDEKKLITKLEASKLESSMITENGQNYLLLKNKGNYIRNAFIQFENEYAIPQMNYFDLEAGEVKKILINGYTDPLKSSYKILTLNDFR